MNDEIELMGSAKVITGIPGPKSKDILEKKEQFIASCRDLIVPTVIKEGKGALVKDIDGNTFLDFTGGWGCLAVGHSHPKVVKAICEQAQKFSHTLFGLVAYESYIRLAERLATLAPGSSDKKVFFFNTGAEAVENAVKICRIATKRGAIVVFENAFHGRTLLTATMTHKGETFKAFQGPFAPEVYRLPLPNPYRNPISFNEVERHLVNAVNPEEVAAVVIEPIQGEGGFIVPSDGFLKFLRELTTKYGMLLVADEVQTGFGRTGKFFACEHFDVEPDLMTLGKSIAAGLPLSAVVGKAEVMDIPKKGSMGGTYPGNPIACRAALAVLDIIEEEKLLDKAITIGQYMKDRFYQMQEKYEIIGDVRGIGAMVAMELVRDRETKEPAPEETKKVIQYAAQRGVLFPSGGLYKNVIRPLVPLVVTEGQLEDGINVLEEAIATISSKG